MAPKNNYSSPGFLDSVKQLSRSGIFATKPNRPPSPPPLSIYSFRHTDNLSYCQTRVMTNRDDRSERVLPLCAMLDPSPVVNYMCKDIATQLVGANEVHYYDTPFSALGFEGSIDLKCIGCVYLMVALEGKYSMRYCKFEVVSGPKLWEFDMIFGEALSTAYNMGNSQVTDWSEVNCAWLEERGEKAPEVVDGAVENFKILPRTKTSLLCRLKIRLEKFTVQHWDWSPFSQPERPVAENNARLQWICSCGECRRADVSIELANKTIEMITEQLIRAQSSSSISAQSSGAGLSPSNRIDQHKQGTVTQASQASQTQSSGQSAGDPTLLHHSRPGSHSQLKVLNSQSAPTFILFCVRTGDERPHTQTLVKPESTDNDFLRDLRREYRQLRSWYYWLHPDRFYFCHCAKFIRWDVRKLAWDCNELPSDPSYIFKSPSLNNSYKMPIRPDEWACRYHRDCSHGKQDFLKYLPKRTTRFELDTWREREEVWGLDVQYRTSAKVVLCWTILFLLPSLVFLALWLMNHASDLQDAAVPLTLSLSGLPVGYVVLGARFRGKMYTEL